LLVPRLVLLATGPGLELRGLLLELLLLGLHGLHPGLRHLLDVPDRPFDGVHVVPEEVLRHLQPHGLGPAPDLQAVEEQLGGTPLELGGLLQRGLDRPLERPLAGLEGVLLPLLHPLELLVLVCHGFVSADRGSAPTLVPPCAAAGPVVAGPSPSISRRRERRPRVGVRSHDVVSYKTSIPSTGVNVNDTRTAAETPCFRRARRHVLARPPAGNGPAAADSRAL
jgi:hypothetical protein